MSGPMSEKNRLYQGWRSHDRYLVEVTAHGFVVVDTKGMAYGLFSQRFKAQQKADRLNAEATR